jgi:hypothetical protein
MSEPMTLVSTALPEKSGYYIARMKMGTDPVADHFGWLNYERWFDHEKREWPDNNFEVTAWRPVNERDRDARDDDDL